MTFARKQWSHLKALPPVHLARLGDIAIGFAGARPRRLPVAECRRILVVRLDEIGDVVLCSPLLRELRRNFPAARITLVVKPQVRELVALCPYVDEILTFDWRTADRKFSRVVLHLRAAAFAAAHLRGRFDLALNPRRDSDFYAANLLVHWSAAPHRIGYRPPAERDAADGLFSTRLDNDAGQHEVRHNLGVLAALGGTVESERLETWIAEDDERAAQEIFLRAGGVAGERLIAVAPGASVRRKEWPVERFTELIGRIHKETGIRAMVVGGPDAMPAGKVLKEAFGDRVIDLAGRTTLRQTAAALARCALYVGNDTGPKHIAAARGVPVVEFSFFPKNGPAGHASSPVRFGAWGVPAVVLQPERCLAPCTTACAADAAHCITTIGADAAFAAVSRFLRSTPNPRNERA